MIRNLRKYLVSLPILLFVVTTAGAQEAPAPTGGAATDTATTGEAIQLVIPPSGVELEPVAVPELFCGDEVENGPCKRFTSVLRRDLNLSGVFQLIDPDAYLAESVLDGSPIPYDSWFNVGARYLIQGKVEKKQKKYQISLQLYDVVGRQKVVLKSSDSWKGKDGLMQIHQQVNAFIKELTGRDGILGSTIVFTQKSRKGGRALLTVRFGDPSPKVRMAGGGIFMFPSFGPGGQLLYTKIDENGPSLYLDGKKLTAPNLQIRSARFAPNGKVIAASIDTGEGQSDIWLLEPNGKQIKNLTKSSEDEVSPRWTRNGKHIVYVSNRVGSPQLYIMKPDGSGKRRVTMVGRYNTAPDTGPNGKVVYAGLDEFVSDIFTTTIGGSQERITQEQGSNRDPAWSPDGRYVVFVSTRGGMTRLFVGTEDGRWQHPLFSRSGAYSAPSWWY